jgi:hypothetical protein
MLCTEVPMSQKQQVPARPSEAWTGMVVFGAVLFVVLGAADAMMGFAAAFNRGLYDVPGNELALPMSYTAWGWLHLVFGGAAVATGLGLMTGRRWATPAGIVIASFNALANLLFSAAYPWWAVTAVAVDVLLIYALTTYRAEDLRRPE